MGDQQDVASQRPAAMTLSEAQRAVDAAILALGGYWPPLANLARLFEECGELARAVNQTHGPKQIKAGEAQRALSEELGDTLFVTLVLANSLGVEAEEALRGALDRAAHRISPPGIATPERPVPPQDSLPTETDL
ncbi:MAG TPA: MazG nucleotide pyrophosphohydrolase domain-containing protein [Ktedonobacterales bacterium]|nr:MazG nucleotide pyrophosphohydrolase domain-containing protein [Ktedonobacterales bacterium]